MSSGQLTLWDLEALETGFQHFSNLRLEEAKLKFHEALRMKLGNKEELRDALGACDYWLPEVKQSQEISEDENPSNKADLLLRKFTNYPFTSQMKYFRVALLSHIGSILSAESPMNLDSVETTFDLLMEAGKLEEAENLILKGISQYPDHPRLHYMQAQVQWLNHEISKANLTYAWLLLHYPREVEKDRIQNKELQQLIDRFGAPMAPLFGWLYKVVPYIPFTGEVETNDREHRRAIECYRLILAANQALAEKGTTSSLPYRKQLRELSPELYDAYFKSLQR